MLVSRYPATALILIFGLAVPLSVHSQSSSEIRKTIETIYHKRDAAVEKKDVNGALAATAPDFVFVSKDGQKGDLKLLKRRLTPLLGLMQSVKSKTTIQNVTLKNNQANASVKQHLEMLVVNPQTQAPQKFVLEATSSDLWTKAASGWLEKRMTTTGEKALLDGQPMNTNVDLRAAPGQGAGKPGKKNGPKKAQ